MKSQEDDLNRAKSELNRLQQEETQLEQSIQAGRAKLETILRSLKCTQDDINQVLLQGWVSGTVRLAAEDFVGCDSKCLPPCPMSAGPFQKARRKL